MTITDSFRDGLLTGILTGVLIEGVRFLLSHRRALSNLFRKSGRRKYSHVAGEWSQYHLTIDRNNSGGPIWVRHKETIRVSLLLKVAGESVNEYKTKLNYEIQGRFDDGRLILHYLNSFSDEKEVTAIIDNVLSSEFLFGVWIGYNYDQTLTTGPIIYSRQELSDVQLDELLRSRRDVIIHSRQQYA